MVRHASLLPSPILTATAAVLLLAAYTTTFQVAMDMGFGEALLGAAANAIPILVWGAVVRAVIIGWLSRRNLALQVAGHVVLCVFFCLFSFWLLIVLLGLINGISMVEFSVRPLPGRASIWQTLENVTTYGIVAVLSYLPRPVPAAEQPAPAAREPDLSRYFIRTGEEIRPVDADRIVCISGADDYAEVTTLDGKHLARMTLADFEQKLDSARFARVHRSWIVNLDHVEQVEPAGGGRMLLRMSNGQTVPASRSGAQHLRDRVI